MIQFLHSFHPQAIIFSLGSINIYWYGLFMILGIISALLITLYLNKLYKLNANILLDLAFYLMLFGIIGARLYDVLLFLPYYLDKPLAIFKIWEGGLAIHGGIIAGLLVIYFFTRKYSLSFWKITALISPGVALGQAIGRWGNYFNQELFGLPTTSSWGIPIDIFNRPLNYLNQQFFQPTFLYESLGNLFIFLCLFFLTYYLFKKNKKNKYVLISSAYMILYSILRFSLEFIRLDATPYFLSLRWPQVLSLITIIVFISIPMIYVKKNKKY